VLILDRTYFEAIVNTLPLFHRDNKRVEHFFKHDHHTVHPTPLCGSELLEVSLSVDGFFCRRCPASAPKNLEEMVSGYFSPL
jgi:hypothetical protein